MKLSKNSINSLPNCMCRNEYKLTVGWEERFVGSSAGVEEKMSPFDILPNCMCRSEYKLTVGREDWFTGRLAG